MLNVDYDTAVNILNQLRDSVIDKNLEIRALESKKRGFENSNEIALADFTQLKIGNVQSEVDKITPLISTLAEAIDNMD